MRTPKEQSNDFILLYYSFLSDYDVSMKLYSRSELIKSICISIFATAILLSFITLITVLRSKKKLSQAETSNHTEAVLNTENQNIISTADTENFVQYSKDITYTTEEAQNIYVYDSCNEAVVNINTQVTAYDWFLQPYVQEGGSGSGSIIDKNGYILTNVHVIQGASKIYVSLFDGTQYEADVIGQDLDSDLAVIKFTPPQGIELKTISFGDSTKLRVGQRVIAIGNPFGLERTITTGKCQN